MSAMMKWLSIILICSGGVVVAVEASWRRQQNNNYVGYNNNNIRDGGIRHSYSAAQRQQRHHHPARQQRHLADKGYGTQADNNNGYSPNFDMLNDNSNNNDRNDTTTNDFYSKSFYERNNMIPPPLTSRIDRYKQLLQRQKHHRRIQDSLLFDNDGSSSSRSTTDAEKNTTSKTNNETTTELQLIIEESKLGNDASTLLREDLVHNGLYDRHAYPWDYAWYNQSIGNKTGIPIEFSINFHRVYSVDVIHPVLDLVAWMRIEWVDPRLTWNPEEYGNLTTAWFWIGEGGSGGETSEIWTPDIELWNLEQGLRESFEDSYAIVSNDGSVYWTRVGHLRPVCKYIGLDIFPFDKLTCQIEFGSWTYSGKYIRLVKGGGTGFSLGGSGTAGATYNEFSFVDDNPIVCEEIVYPPYPAAPEEDWPVLMYNVTIQRSWQPYVRGYIMLQVLLNIVGFSAFWLPPSCGERMSLSVTAMLAAIASEIVVAANLPAAAEYTWFQKFSILSMCFAFASLLESVIVLYFYYKRSEDLVPWWASETKKWYIIRQARKQGRELKKRASDIVDETSDRMHHKMDNVRESIMKRRGSDDDAKSDDDDFFAENKLSNQNIAQTKVTQPDADSDSLVDPLENKIEEKASEPVSTDRPATPPQSKEVTSSDDHSDDSSVELLEKESKDKLGDLYGESNGNFSLKVTDLIDEKKDAKDNSDWVQSSEHDFGVIQTGKTFQDSMISNLSFDDALDAKDLKPSPPVRRGARRGQEKRKSVNFAGVSDEKFDTDNNPDFGPRLSLSNKSRRSMMNELKATSSDSMYSIMVPRDADDFNNEDEVKHNKRWKVYAARIDDVARFWFPVAFAISLAIVLAEVF